MKRPTKRQIEATLDVLGWLSEQTDLGNLSESIGEIRDRLWDLLEAGS